MKKIVILILIADLLYFIGCTGSTIKPILFEKLTKNNTKKVNKLDEYYLGHYDIISVKFYYHPNLNEEVVVRPDGKISLQLIQEVVAEGKSPRMLAKEITSKYRKFLKRPNATVIVRQIAKQRIYIGGEVKYPGVYKVEILPTALQFIFQAGGLKDTANISNIVLIRRSQNGKPKIYLLDIEEPENDIYLRSFDILFVSKSAIASVDLFVEQYINRLLPIGRSIGFSYVYDLNKKY